MAPTATYHQVWTRHFHFHLLSSHLLTPCGIQSNLQKAHAARAEKKKKREASNAKRMAALKKARDAKAKAKAS